MFIPAPTPVFEPITPVLKTPTLYFRGIFPCFLRFFIGLLTSRTILFVIHQDISYD